MEENPYEPPGVPSEPFCEPVSEPDSLVRWIVEIAISIVLGGVGLVIALTALRIVFHKHIK